MRQKLPGPDGYPLIVNDIGRTVYPGEEFDCPLPVPGCVPVDAPGSTPEGGEGNDGAEQPGEAGDSKQAAKDRASGKGERP